MEYQVQDAPEEWSLHTTRHDGIPVVAVTGEVDMSTAPELTTELITQVEQRPAALVVHLGQVSFFGSSGIAALLDTHDRAKSRRVPLHLVAPGPNVVKTLQLTGLAGMLPRHETLSGAIDAIGRAARERKRIAIVSVQASPLFADLGQGTHVGQLSAALSTLGHEVVVYTRRTDPAAPERVRTDDGYDVAHVPAGPARPLAEDQVTPHLGEFAEFLAQRWRLRPPDVVHAHHWTSGLVAVIGAHSLQVPVVHSYNALDSHEAAQRADAEALLARRASWVVATSSQEAAELRRRGVRRAQVSVVPCGVDVALFHPDGPVARRGRRRRVVAAGEQGRHSGVAGVVTALSTMEDTELVIAGEDAGAAELRKLARGLGMLDRVVFAGAVPRAGMPALLRSADVVVCVPSFEPFGMVALQAMACGVPVVAAAVGALQDVVVHGVTGLHVPPREPRVLARTLRQLLADDTRRQEFGAAARDRIIARHSRDRLGAELLAVYRRVDRVPTGLDTAQGSA